MDKFIKPVADALENAGYQFEITKRTKTPYSVWHKMQQKHVEFEDIYDSSRTSTISTVSVSSSLPSRTRTSVPSAGISILSCPASMLPRLTASGTG